jgi:hypothetical protein
LFGASYKDNLPHFEISVKLHGMKVKKKAFGLRILFSIQIQLLDIENPKIDFP